MVVGGNGNDVLLVSNLFRTAEMAVETCHIFAGKLVFAQTVEDVDEMLIALPEYLVQLHADHLFFPEGEGLKEMHAPVIPLEQLPFLIVHNWRQLLKVADHKHLRSPETFGIVSFGTAHAEVDGIQDVGP